MPNSCPAHQQPAVPLPLDPTLPRTASYADGAAVLRSAAFSVDVYHENALLLEGTLLASDGERHKHLKRIEGALFSAPRLAHYEQEVLAQVVGVELAAVAEHRGADGVVRSDLIPLVRRLALRISAEVVGLDGIDADRLSLLTGFVARLGDGILIQWATRDHGEILRDAAACKQEFWDDFVEPALRRRRALQAEGHLEATDLLSVLLLDTTLTWSDEDILKEALLYMAAAAFTTATAVTHSVAELTDWLHDHPEAKDKLTDSQFLRTAGMESLRLHPGRHVLIRAAAEATTMPDGTSVEPGQIVLVDKFHSNMDEQAYGGSVDRFDPDRTIAEGTLPYGLSFGAGRHQCLGKPLVIGTPDGRSDSREGTLALLLGALFTAGVERDPDNPPVRPESVHDRYESFPVRFTAL